MSAVGRDLFADFSLEQLAANRFASRAGRELGQRTSGDVQCQGFAEQVSVRTEIVRDVSFDVRKLLVQPEQQIDDPRGAVASDRIHDSERSASSSMLAQLIPMSGGLLSSQLAIWRMQASRYRRSPVSQNARPSVSQC